MLSQLRFCTFQAKKQGGDLAEEDAKTLEFASAEQSRMQKQLEALRKQQRAHTQLLQDYKAKQQVSTRVRMLINNIVVLFFGLINHSLKLVLTRS